jgi:putative nucleotidyltransferase with HDIG domain
MASNVLPLIDVEQLQLGIYVVLDVGWRHHPFALNSFTVRTGQQLEQLRSLGPRQIRYCPERSSAPPLAAGDTPQASPPDPVTDVAARLTSIASAAPAARSVPIATTALTAPRSADNSLDAFASTAADPRIEDPLARQQDSLARVEAAFAQATGQHQRLMDVLLEQPREARRLAEGLGDAMSRWVGEQGELSVRLLSQQAGQPTSSHEVAVTALSLLLARECGFSPDEVRRLALAALLHDIGKLRIPTFLQQDNGRLTVAERRTYRRHVELGVTLAKFLELPAAVVRTISEHHEFCDGKGFPSALRGHWLSPAGRLLAIVNRYQELACPLHGVSGLTPHLALQRMYGTERAHFDPEYLPRFVRMMGIYPPGTLVELSDQRMAIVIASRPGKSLSPRVQVLERPDDDQPSLAFDIEAEGETRIQRGLRPSQLNPRWAQRAQQWARAGVFLEALPLRRAATGLRPAAAAVSA